MYVKRMKPGSPWIWAALLAVQCNCVGAQSRNSLWDMRSLSRPPAATWGERNGLLQEVYYEGEPLNGKPTRIFAYFAKPEGRGPFPGMVLVHGGGGKAFSDWALHWAKRGYAAIAMDLAGNGPKGRLPDGGPDQSDTTKFRPFQDSEAREMWTYHAVAAAIRAHSLLADQPGVNKNRIGLTGISWGGYLTCIIAGVDHRFKAAVPVYGCGFLHENSAWKSGILDKMPDELRERWVLFFDPFRYLPGVRCPILFLNGTNDFAYPMDSYKKCYSLVKSPRTISVQIRLPHGHIWTYGIVDAFIDSQLRGGQKLARLSVLRVHNGYAETSVSSQASIAKAELYFTNDTGKWQDRLWQSIPAKIDGSRITAGLPSAGPAVFYLAVTDSDGNVVTTEHISTP
jgi:dienelactone hydrolase